MRNIYDEPKLSIICFAVDDIVRTSPTAGGSDGDDWVKDDGFGDFLNP